MKSARLPRLALLPFLLLGACARLPPAAPPAPARSPPSPTLTAPAPSTTTSAAAATRVTTAPTPPVDLWVALRASFAMDDCDSDPGITAWAKRDTRNPDDFTGKLEAVLPQLAYVQKLAARYGIPGEFALLPWVESKFHPTAKSRGRTAGMWQITPVTAGAMGLRVDGHYDGRLDVAASANGVMKLLAGYYEEFGDWRVADYAYHAGSSATARFIARHGMPPEHPTIPHWPKRDVTRQHLTKLLAIACVVREPARFHVELPTLAANAQLVHVPIEQSMPMAAAAQRAGMPVDLLRYYNAGFLGNMVNADAASFLLLPARHAEQFLSTPPADLATPALLDDGTGAVTGDARPPQSADAVGPTTHRVRNGDTLWGIARRYGMSVDELRRWNHLSSDSLHPGQTLRLTRAS